MDETKTVYTPGKLPFFDEKPFIDAANILVAADEPMKAIALLENLPGYYRDHRPTAIAQMLGEIYALLATPAFYKDNIWDSCIDTARSVSTLMNTLRGNLIEKDVKEYNDKNLMPHIIDLGPGEYWLPIALHEKGYRFTYNDIGLSSEALEKAKPLISGHLSKRRMYESQPTIFIACEIIEHLHHERDILTDYLRAGGNADIIHISTPKYSYDVKPEKFNWREQGDLGHLRTYTPREFEKVVVEMFPHFVWGYAETEIMHMRGHKK